MRVFVLNTGRCGSTTFAAACSHISNFTSAHESRIGCLEDRLEYPDDHIEVDNRLSWFLGLLGERYGDEPLYVHLTRDRELVAASFARRTLESTRPSGRVRRLELLLEELRTAGRTDFYRGIASAFSHDVVARTTAWGPEQQLTACRLYVDSVNANIRAFLERRPHTASVTIDDESDFVDLWQTIGAEGDLDAALAELRQHHNASR